MERPVYIPTICQGGGGGGGWPISINRAVKTCFTFRGGGLIFYSKRTTLKQQVEKKQSTADSRQQGEGSHVIRSGLFLLELIYIVTQDESETLRSIDPIDSVAYGIQ